MKKMIITTVVALALSAAAQADQRMPTHTIKGTAAPINTIDNGAIEHQSVSFSFPITDINMLDFSAKPSHSQSREYTLEVSGSDLQKGLSMNTSAQGALVRISAYDGKSAIEPQDLSIISHKSTGQQRFAKGSGFETLVDSQSMQKNGMGFQSGTTGFKVAEHLGHGRFTLKADSTVNPNMRYRINVFEKNSDTALYLNTNKNSYLTKDVLQMDAKVFSQGQAQSIQSINGNIVSPSGQSYPAVFSKSDDGYQVNMPLNMAHDHKVGALWELETEVQALVDGQLVQRNARVPFAYAKQTAELSSKPYMVGSIQNLQAMVPVNVKNAGRYEVRAVLYATNDAGQKQAVMVTHSAAGLATGSGLITMQFDADILAKSGLKAPFEIGQLELRDQTQMAVLP